jgi:protein-disulfide isomerase
MAYSSRKSPRFPTFSFLLVLLFALFLGARHYYPTILGAEVLSPLQVQDIVARYIRDHPNEIIAAIDEYKMQQEQLHTHEVRAKAVEELPKLVNEKDAPYIGNLKGDVSLVEFYDYQCGHCLQVEPVLAQLAASDPNVRIIFKPIAKVGATSDLAARAALAVYRLNPAKFVAFHRALLERGGGHEKDIMALAKTHGIDSGDMQRVMSSPEVMYQVKTNGEQAVELGSKGTPFFIIGDDVATGAMDIVQLRLRVEAARKGRIAHGEKAEPSAAPASDGATLLKK